MSESSLWSTLLHRRLPQIVGMYIAATWMAVEIGEWVTEKLALDGALTLRLFLIMVTLLPSVVVIAWNHGAPGKDRWTGFEQALVPVNLLVALLVASLVSRPEPSVVTTDGIEEKVLVDEAGVPQVFEVASVDHHHRVAAFFWDNDGAEDQAWLGYAIPVLLAADLAYSPFVDLDAPYEMINAEDLKVPGAERGLNVPITLQLDLARRRLIPYLLHGNFTADNGRIRLEARLYDVPSAAVIAGFELSGGSLLPLLDDLTRQLRQTLIREVPDAAMVTSDLPLAEHFSSSMDAVAEVVAALNLRFFDNDYAGALERLSKAVEIDPAFASAHAHMALLQRASGNNQAALAALDRALAVDYKLDPEQRFLLKAERYAVQGQVDKAIRVLEMWAEVHPYSVQAHRLLGHNLMLVSRLQEAERVFQKVRRLDPSAERTLLTLADIQRMNGDYAGAIESLDSYLAGHPDDAAAVLSMAQVRTASGDFDAARDAYERAGFLDADDFDAELGLAQLDVRQGRFDSAHQRLTRLAARELGARDQFQLGMAQVQLLRGQGRIAEALGIIDVLAAAARGWMPPVQQVLTIGTMRASLQVEIGDDEQALSELEELASQIQPPMDGVIHFSRAGVLELMEDQERFRQTLAAAEAFAASYQLPVLQSFLESYRARVALWEGRHDEAVERYRHAQQAMRGSFIALIDDYTPEYLSLALVEGLLQGGHRDEAEAILRRHLERFPADGLARLKLARLLLTGDRAGEATDILAPLQRQWSDADEDYRYLKDLQSLQQEIAAGV